MGPLIDGGLPHPHARAGVRDETGAAPTPWGRWTRQWTAEENRHGDLMNKYCYLSGRVNMRVSDARVAPLSRLPCFPLAAAWL